MVFVASRANKADYMTRCIWITLQVHRVMQEFVQGGLQSNLTIATAFMRFLVKTLAGNAAGGGGGQLKTLTDKMGVEAFWAAWEACPEGCMPLILGDLNVNFVKPRDELDEVICNLIDDVDLVDASRRYTPCRPRRQLTRARWTWRQKREGKMLSTARTIP